MRWATSARPSSTCLASMKARPIRSARSASWSATSTPVPSTRSSSSGATRPTTPRPISTSPRHSPAARSSLRIHLGLYDDETAQLCHWHVPEAHCLESWGDLRAFDGTATIQQPLDRAALRRQVRSSRCWRVLLGEPGRSGLEIVRDYWRRQSLPGDFESAWHQALRTGMVAGTARKAQGGRPARQ